MLSDHKSNSHLKQASNKENYSVTEYNNYVPTEVRDASDEYKELYYTKYRPANDRLNKTMIDVTYTSFKCDLAMQEQEEIDDHIRNVHGVEYGVNSMKPVQRIEVDTKIVFILPSILEIELVGSKKRKALINSIYTCSVARNVINKTPNKNTADLNMSRSKDFMTELSKSAPTNFFSRFKMHLYEALEGIDIDADFTCKWSVIEKALYLAMSKEQNTLRLSNFYDKDYDQFHSLPLELIINQVDTHVDSVLGKSTAVHKDKKGRTLSDYIYSIRTKYRLIFTIARHLSNYFKQIKEHIMQVITNMHDNITAVVDIADFQKNISIVFETKGVLSQFKNEKFQRRRKAWLFTKLK